ncbi:hypothetical protein CRYUN_Cryun01aG0023700 [Craigia yunnanensis]
MLEWQEWFSNADEDESRPFSHLRELYIRNCPKLSRALPKYLPCLSKLCIMTCGQLMDTFPGVPVIRELELGNCSKVPFTRTPAWVPERLKVLKIENCGRLDFPAKALDECQQDLISLCSLELCRCINFVSFPKGGLRAPNLTSLWIYGCEKFESLPEHMHTLLPSLQSLNLFNCPKLESFPDGGLPSNLNSLCISNCDKLIAKRLEWGSHRLYSLKGPSLENVKMWYPFLRKDCCQPPISFHIRVFKLGISEQ